MKTRTLLSFAVGSLSSALLAPMNVQAADIAESRANTIEVPFTFAALESRRPIRPRDILARQPPLSEPVFPHIFISPEQFDLLALLGLSDTRLQISHTNEGIPLVIRTLPFLTTTAMSYIKFGRVLKDAGVADRILDIPVVQQGIGNLAMAAIGALSGGFATAYEVRFKVNNLYTVVDNSTFRTSLEQGAFIYKLALSSGNPTIKCEANALSFVPFGFPIPVGWSDPLCPDANMPHAEVRMRFVPMLDANGAITIADATVTLEGEIDVSPIDFLDEFLKLKQRIKEGFESQFRNALLTPEFRNILANNLKAMLETQYGRPIRRITSLTIDGTGISAVLPLE